MLLKLSFRLAKRKNPTTNKQQSRVDSDKKKNKKNKIGYTRMKKTWTMELNFRIRQDVFHE